MQTTTYEVTRTFANGARLLATGDVEFGVDGDGRVYWANTAGWDMIVDALRDGGGDFTEKWYPHSMHHTDTFFKGQALQMANCEKPQCANAAPPRPVYDANPDPAKRRVVGQVAICDPCQERIDTVNARIAR